MSAAVVPAVRGSSSPRNDQEIDPILQDIGLLTGLLQSGGDTPYALNKQWFDNPIAATQTGVRNHAPQLTDLLIRLLGSIGGNALGVPATDPALLGTWIPIPNPANSNQPTNLYVVSYASGNATVFGFGTKVAWEKTLSTNDGNGTLNGPAGVQVEAWALLPLLKIDPATGLSVALAEKGAPVSIGIAIEGQDKDGKSASLFTAGTAPNSISFDGIKLSAEIDLADGPSVDMSLVVLNMVLPGEAAVNRSLADLEALPASEIMQVASTLFVAALSDLSEDAAAKAGYFLPLVGLSQYIPGNDTRLPLLPWWELAGLAIAGKNVTAPFIQWFTTVTASSDFSKAWLFSASGLMGVSSLTASTVTGTGSREDPYLAPLIVGGALPGTLSLSLASWVDDSGLRHFYPGLIFQATPITLGSAAVLAFQTTLELAEFKLYTDQSFHFAGPSSLRLETTIALENSDSSQPLFSGEIGGDDYVFGKFEAGLTVDAAGDVLPLCQLTGIQSPAGDFDVIDLTSPGQLASAATQELLSLIQSGLKQMLGIDGSDNVPFAANIAALIGVIAPPAAKSWPAEAPQPPFAATQIGQSIADPIGSLAGYYQGLLTSTQKVDGQVPFYYVLQELASLLQVPGSASIAITGTGQETDPWRAVLSVADTQLPAALTVYATALAPDITRLFLGLELGPNLTLPGGFACQPLVSLHFVSLDLPAPASTTSISASWLPDVTVSLNLPKGFSTPPVAKSSFSVSSASLSAGWSRYSNWTWSLVARSPVFTINGVELPFSGDLDWGDQTSLQNLVLEAAASFAPVLTGVIGVGLTCRDTRIGTALTGVLGLLPDPTLVPNFPAALKTGWSAAGLTPLKLTGLSNPWPDICSKLGNDFASPASGSAVLGLLGWVLNPGQADPPSVAGTGADGDPWRVPLAGTAFELVSSYVTATSLLGLGLGRSDHLAPSDTLAIDLQTTLAATQFSTATGKLAPQEGWPSLQFTCTVSNPKGNLVQIGSQGSTGYTVVKAVVLGFSLSLTKDGLSLLPIITLQGAQLPAQTAAKDYTFQDLNNLTSDLIQSYEGALNQAVQVIVGTLAPKKGLSGPLASGFSNAYDLLSLLGLTLPVAAGAGTGYGINPGGWQGLVADPVGYAKTQVLSLLTDPAHRSAFFQFISNVLGIQLPTVPPLALQTLSTLGFLGDEAHGYPLLPKALLEFAQSPFSSLQAQFETLYVNGELSDSAQALISALNQSIIDTPFGKYFTFQAVQGRQIQLAVPEASAFAVGDLFTISGSVAFDLQTRTLSAEVDLYNPTVRLTLQPCCAYTLGGALAPGLQVVWGDGSLPAPQSLELYPFDSTRFLNQLADLAPAYVLSTVVTQVLENYVLKQYPLAQFLFQALGLATKDDDSGKWQMPSLLGLLDDPKGWLLSTVVLGDENGRFNLGSLQKALARIPAAEIASLGIGIKPYSQNNQTGVQIYGFPYGFGATIATDGSTTSNFLVQTQDQAIGTQAKVEKLQAGLTLGPTFQPGIIGDIRLSGAVSDFTLFAEAGYNDGFSFSLGQIKDTTPLTIQLVPFLGWGTLAGQAAQVAASALINTLVPKLLTALKDRKSDKLNDFIERLESAGTSLSIPALVSSLTSIPLDKLSPATVEAAVVTWLLDRFSTTNAPDTAKAVVALLNGVLPGTLAVGTGTDAGLTVYQPAKAVPLTIYLGVSGESNLGIWAGLELPSTSLLTATIQRTGVGFPVAQLASGPSPVFQFGVDLQMPVEKTSAADGPCFGPWLSLTFDAATSRFVGQFDPLYNAGSETPNSSLQIQLFPACSLNSTQALETWMLGIVTQVLPRYVSAVVLNTDAIKAWLSSPIIKSSADSPTPAVLLLGAQLITNDGTAQDPVYVLTPFDQLAQLTVEKFLGGLLYALMQKEIKVLSWGDPAKKTDGGLWIGPESSSATSLGVRVAAPGLQLASIPNLTIQLGAADDDWVTHASTTPPSYKPGLSFYIPSQDTDGDYTPDFTSVALNLVNLGIDYTGKAGRPLVDLARFQLGGVSPRVLFALAFASGKVSKLQFGGALELDSIALALTPSQASSSGNPVAQNLLGAGGTSDGSDSGTKNPPTNPAFSLQAAYLEKLYVALLDANGDPATRLWFPVQRGFGPIYVNKVGFGWEGALKPPLLDLMFDGSVALAGFELDLIGLSVGIPVSSDITDFSKYKLELDGFDLSFQGGPVSLTAEFLKTPISGTTEYSGLAILKLSQFSIMAVGSYAAVPTNPPAESPTATSLFIFGALNAPLGGVPAFFITGIAAGFSYNRGLNLPSITEVQTFPLVQGVVEGSFTSGSAADTQSALATLAEDVYPAIGQYWLAAGVKFTSFRLIDGFGMVFIEFGRSFQIAFLGVASMALPKAVARDNALAYVELALKAVINPTVGFVSVEAQLTPNSFVIAKECKLTGGFAFYLWFKNQMQGKNPISAGDFVLTLGGYAPAFQKPAHYPDVPRLGFYWPLDLGGIGSLNVAGGAYFALTPSSVMAGGYLKAMFKAGPIKAWFDAHADFYIAWAPFYFDVDIGVEVGVSFGTTIAGVSVTLSASLGASLHLKGPPTAGEVEVNWCVISFTIPFGEGATPSSASLDWDAFASQFLPEPSSDSAPGPAPAPAFAAMSAMPRTLLAPQAKDSGGDQQQVLKLSVDSGLTQSGASQWTIQAEPFILRIDSAIPINKITVTNPGAPAIQAGTTVGLQPANKSSVNTPLTITINDATGTAVDLRTSPVRFNTDLDAAPMATWGSGTFNHGQTPDGSDMLVDGTVKTVRIIGDQTLSTSSVGPFAVANLAYTINTTVLLPFASQLPFNKTPVYQPSAPIPGQHQALAKMMETIMDPGVVALRSRVFRQLSQFGIVVVDTPSLVVMKSSANLVVQAPPVLAHLDVFLASAQESGVKIQSRPALETVQVRASKRKAVQAPRKTGILRRHSSGGARFGRWSSSQISGSRQGLAARAEAVSTSTSASLQPGSITHWEGEVAQLHYAGETPARFTCFDHNDELVADIHDHLSREALVLPAGVRAVSAHGLEPRTAELDVAGWSTMDEVLRVNSRHFLGDGFTLRPQAFAAMRRNRRPLEQGLVDISAVQAANQVSNGRQGGTDTFFSGRMRTAAIVVAKGVSAEQIAVSLSHPERPSDIRPYERLNPVATLELEDRTVYFYTIATPPTQAGHLAVWATPTEAGVQILGVWAATTTPEVWLKLWKRDSAPLRATPPIHNARAASATVLPAAGHLTLSATL